MKNGKKDIDSLVDGASSSRPSAAKSSNAEQQSKKHSSTNTNSNDINMNHGPDIKTMRIPEIKRELHLYGIKTDDFLEKRDLEDALLTERRLRMPPPPPSVVTNGGSEGPKVRVIAGVGNVKQSSTTPNKGQQHYATQLNMMSSSSSDNQNQNSPEYIYDSQQTPNEQAKLRELQIAYEYERIQQQLPNPSDIQYELESKFNISTKYFIGIKEMGYALAVARVDNMIERQLLGLEADGCVVDENGVPVPIREGVDCTTTSSDELLPSAEQLINMEYDNLYTSWDEESLSGELESQYGIPAKHFMGKKEMAYALAVERVDRAIKEGGLIMDDYEEEEESYGEQMSDDDMMKLMEEEMMKEEEEERRDREERRTQLRSQSSFGGKTFKKEEPNLFGKTKRKSRLEYQSTPLADMIQDDKKGRRRPPKRTPISSEPPHSFGTTQRQQRQGSVIGEQSSSGSSAYANKQSLTDILKGSEQQKSRSRATTPPSRRPPKMPQSRSSRTKSFKTSSARVDEAFRSPPVKRRGNSYGNSNDRGYKTSWGKQNNNAVSSAFNNIPPPNSNNRGYASSWNKGSPSTRQYDPGSAAKATDKRSRSSSTNSQRPFEPAPFTEPGSFNTQGSSSSRREPKRVPPQTPFTSPVTDGARGNRRGGGSQGPFTPFTNPGKRSTNGKPPPRKRPTDPRGFNIKDTPDATQPFMGSAYFDQNTAYSPPLQVEPPPRDPNYEPPPFEPAPFSNPQPHAVRTDRTAGPPPRDKWNRVNNNAPPKSSQSSTNNNKQRQDRQNQKKQRVGSFAFNNLKDMFSNKGNKKEDDDAPKKVIIDEPRGFKSGNVEVFSSNDNDSTPKDQSFIEVEIIDAEMDTEDDWDEEEEEKDIPQTAADRFSNAWKGGPKTTPPSPSFFTNIGDAPTTTSSHDTTNGSSNGKTIDDDAIIQEAQHLLSTNAGIRAIVTRAQSNPKIQEAVQECMDDPSSFGVYLNDPDVGPMLQDLKELCLSL